MILTERDPKESGIADFVSGYLLLSALPGLHRLLLGDFRPGMGQGLLFSRQDRSATGLAWARPSSNSRIGSRSSTEEGALRGIYLESLPGFLTWSAFAGRATWDAATDSTENAAIRRGGEHVSPLQKSRKHALTERIVSLRLTSRLPFGKVGLSLCHLAFSAPVLTSGPPRQQQTPVGLNWNLSVRNVALFGELAPGPETAWLSGTTLRFNTLRLTVLARRYDPSYYAPHAAAFSAYSGWPHNEWGLFAGAAWAPRKGTRIQLDLDRHGRLLPETDAPLPSRGERFTFSMTQRLSRHQNLDLTLGTQQETVTTSSRTGPRLRKRYRVAYSLHPPEFRIRAWTEITRGATPARRGIGAATAADLRLGRSSGPRLDLWFTRFHTTAYEARIYMFEPDVWGGSRLQVLSGSGQAFGTRLSWSGAVFSFSGRYSFKRTPEGVSSSWSFQVDLGSLE